jgi:hypothetical protein
MKPTKLQIAARWYGEHGLPIFPLAPKTKMPFKDSNGYKDSTTNAEQIRAWWTAHPRANIALDLGAARKLLFDVDYDAPGAVVHEREDVVRLFGAIPDTGEVVTGSGQRHIYFGNFSQEVPAEIAKGVHLKCAGSHAVLPPSVHPDTGKEYAWDGLRGSEALLDCADPPAWLLEAIAAAKTAKRPANDSDEPIPEGERNDRLFRLGCRLRRDGLSQEAIEAALLAENRRRCQPPLDANEARKIAHSAARYQPGGFAEASVNLNALPPNLATLNALAVFGGRLAFASVRRRDSMILAITTEGAEILWPSTAELGKFGPSQAIISDATGVFLPTPPQGRIRASWEPAASLLLQIASEDQQRLEHPLREETRELLRLMWRASGQAAADSNHAFINYVRAVLAARRDPQATPPPSVFVFEEACWVHLPTLRRWLSIPALTNKNYPLEDVRRGLLLLGFEYFENVTRRVPATAATKADAESCCLWRGPLVALGVTSLDSPE